MQPLWRAGIGEVVFVNYLNIIHWNTNYATKCFLNWKWNHTVQYFSAQLSHSLSQQSSTAQATGEHSWPVGIVWPTWRCGAAAHGMLWQVCPLLHSFHPLYIGCTVTFTHTSTMCVKEHGTLATSLECIGVTFHSCCHGTLVICNTVWLLMWTKCVWLGSGQWSWNVHMMFTCQPSGY